MFTDLDEAFKAYFPSTTFEDFEDIEDLFFLYGTEWMKNNELSVLH